MGDEIANILGLNRRPRAGVNVNKYFKNRTQNVVEATQDRLTNTMEYTKNKISNAREGFGKMSTMKKFLLVGGILLLLVMIGIIIKFVRDQQRKKKFSSEPLFMTGIEENKPHNTKKIYRYTNPNTGRVTPYIPNQYFNDRNGSEFTFSYWMYIDGREWNYRFGEWKHIFHRGTSPILPIDGETTGGENEQITKLTTQMPAFWLSPKENTLNCSLTTGDSGEERITIEDIPINKWINVVLVVGNNSGNLYMDGKLYRTVNLMKTLNATKDAVYVNYFGGFGGKMAYLQYFDRALTPKEVEDLYREFKTNIDKYIKNMFNKEISKTNLPITIDKQKCNYMAFIKEKKDKEEYIKKILNINETLCKNTKDMTDTECQVQNKKLKKLIDSGIPITELKMKLNKLIKNIKPINERVYKYVDEEGKNQTAYLTSTEYKKLISMKK